MYIAWSLKFTPLEDLGHLYFLPRCSNSATYQPGQNPCLVAHNPHICQVRSMGPIMECIRSSWSYWWLGTIRLKIYWAWFKSGSVLSSNLRSRIQASKRPSWLPEYKFLKEMQALQGPLWRGASFNLLFLSSPETSETFLKSQMFRKSLQVPSKHLGRESTIALIHHV